MENARGHSPTKAGTGFEDWRNEPPYQITGDFQAKWTGHCHCGKIQYELNRDKPLASKYCHCRTCQRLHGVEIQKSNSDAVDEREQAPFQWAAIFHKTDIQLTHGAEGLEWYDAEAQSQTHHLPCKVYCKHCRTPIMDEGRRMIMLFPSLVNGITTADAREKWRVQCHMFYAQRVVNFKGDGVTKWAGMEKTSPRVDDDGVELAE